VPAEEHSPTEEKEQRMFTEVHERSRIVSSGGAQTPFTFFQRSWPLNPSATVTFTLEETQEITLKVYDSFGKLIHTLYDQAMMKAGYHELQLYGEAFPVGGCYARLVTRTGVQQRTLILNALTT
jgi:hypothetical protein